MNRRNKELNEKIKQVSMEAQSWHYRARFNESVVSVLKNNLKQAVAQGASQGREGCGDSEVDDAASSYGPPPLPSAAPCRRRGPWLAGPAGAGRYPCCCCRAGTSACAGTVAGLSTCAPSRTAKTAGVPVFMSDDPTTVFWICTGAPASLVSPFCTCILVLPELMM
ncbi:unnamed protein product [Spirodela intermedia]|uniref:Uncharacterized protein n=1 Tax=Spirodela intermedia TaxID=51605 RepID=A0A7I8JNV7_SPIIN|nr:unnamed protein product [Spirodela intermedia]CAA6671451.1 unnamed protein product [Spirodela intermedia]